MPVITYLAVDRGELVGGHTASTSYQIETKFQAFPRQRVAKGEFDESLNGTPEAWVDAWQLSWSITSDLIFPSAIANWREFFSSVAGREAFTIDFVGTIGSPSTPNTFSVFLLDQTVTEQQIAAAGFQYAFNVRKMP